MKNRTVIHLCISETNQLLQMALRDHVLKDGEFDVSQVEWDSREMEFRITLDPIPSNAPISQT